MIEISDKKIEHALITFNYENISHRTLAKFLEFNKQEIAMMEIFWEPTFNRSWLYLPREMIEEWFCPNQKGKDAVRDFCRRILLKKYDEKIDYKEIDATDLLIINCKFHSADLPNKKTEQPSHGNRAKYYAVTGECFKMIFLR